MFTCFNIFLDPFVVQKGYECILMQFLFRFWSAQVHLRGNKCPYKDLFMLHFPHILFRPIISHMPSAYYAQFPTMYGLGCSTLMYYMCTTKQVLNTADLSSAAVLHSTFLLLYFLSLHFPNSIKLVSDSKSFSQDLS